MDSHAFDAIINAILQLAAAALLGFGSWAIGRILTWLNLRNSSEINEALDSALNKSITYGIQHAYDTIRQKGWDSLDVRNKTVLKALDYCFEHFSDTLKAAGIDVSDRTKTSRLVKEALDRAFPQAAANIAALPTTPPLPTDSASRGIAGIPTISLLSSSFTVRQGHRYQATVNLGILEQLATNDMVAERFKQIGFQKVTVTGEGATRTAIGTWSGADTTAPLDPHLSGVREV